MGDSSLVACREIQRRFLARLGPHEQFRQLFDLLNDVYFFVKDDRSRMVFASRPFYERLGVKSEEEILGRTDYEFFPTDAADHFVKDDRHVIATGQPLIGRVELWYNARHELDWFTTNKLPVFDQAGTVIGVMGTVRSYEKQRSALRHISQIDATVDYIRQHDHERLNVEDLAASAGLSSRQLNRKFQEVFGLSVQEFLVKTRLQATTVVLMQSDCSIADIANDFGFCDQSAFTRLFRKHMGMTPLKFRQQYRR